MNRKFSALRSGLVCSAALALLCVAAVQTQPRYQIAFTSQAPRNQQLFLADGDGTNARPLVPHGSFDSNASFSPDGQWVVFTSTREGSADLFRVRLDGSGLERLTDSPAFDDQAAFSPDGRAMAFVSSRSGQADIWVLELETRRLVNVTNHPAGDFRPAWSPDGRSIAFSSDRDSPRAVRGAPGGLMFVAQQSTDIYVAHLDGSPDGKVCGESRTAMPLRALRRGRATVRRSFSTRRISSSSSTADWARRRSCRSPLPRENARF